jgi:glycolate oxidase iron-sulfur subunit
MLWREEMDSPRGRIYLMQMAADGKAALDDKFVQHFDRCLGCMSCMSACPSGVNYGKLVEATRAQIERNHRRGSWDRLQRHLVFALFPNPRRLKLAALLLWAYQKLGLRWLVRNTGLLRLLPQQMADMESLLPELSLPDLPHRRPAVIPAVGSARKRVGLILGCVQRVFFDKVNAATIRVLTAEGCDVYIPPEQGCCGALGVHCGREQEALAAARKLIDVFDPLDLDYIVVNAAGCGSTVKEYGHLLRDDPVYADKAKAFAARCRDISELLCELSPQARRNPVPMRVVYQDACHLLHAQSVQRQPREVLKAIPGIELVEIAEAGMCCGSAGVYNLLQSETARTLGRRKANNIARTSPDALVSANPGCLLQISKELRRGRPDIQAYHLVELVDRSIRASDKPMR